MAMGIKEKGHKTKGLNSRNLTLKNFMASPRATTVLLKPRKI